MPTTGTESLDLEWERVEVLAQCLLSSRVDVQPKVELFDRLEGLQQRVMEDRASPDSPWLRLPIRGLPALALE